jgi:hypothetical protein
MASFGGMAFDYRRRAVDHPVELGGDALLFISMSYEFFLDVPHAETQCCVVTTAFAARNSSLL